MEKIMVNRKYFKTILFFILSFLFIELYSCSNISEDQITQNTDINQSCSRLVGKIIDSEQIDSDDSRTALPSGVNVASVNLYKITATNASKTITITGTATLSGTSATYSIDLPIDEWNIKIELYNDESHSTLIMKGEKTVSVTTVGGLLPDCDIKLGFVAEALTTGKGNVQLKISSDFAINKIHITCNTHGSTCKLSTDYTSEDLLEDVPAGSHDVSFEIFDDKDVCCFSFQEVINVFASLTTNVWKSQASYVSADGSEINLTSDLVKNYKQTVFYVLAAGNNAHSGSFFFPIQTVQNAIEKISSINDESTEYKVILLGNLTESSITMQGNKNVKVCIFSANSSNINSISLQNDISISEKSKVTFKDVKIFGSGTIINEGELQVKGNVELGNVKLASGKTIKIDGTIDSSVDTVATITPNSDSDYPTEVDTPGATVLSGTNIASYCSKFKLAKKGYYINANGKIALKDGYYVSSTGNDTNDGSKNSPLLTVKEAVARCIADFNDDNSLNKFDIFVKNNISDDSIVFNNSSPLIFNISSDSTTQRTITGNSTATIFDIKNANATVNLSNLKITGGKCGIKNNGNLSLKNVTITGNKGDGGLLNSNILKLEGKANISLNYKSDGTTSYNLILADGKFITILGDISGSNIGITTLTEPTLKAPIIITEDYSEKGNTETNIKTFFKSDSSSFVISPYMKTADNSIFDVILGLKPASQSGSLNIEDFDEVSFSFGTSTTTFEFNKAAYNGIDSKLAINAFAKKAGDSSYQKVTTALTDWNFEVRADGEKISGYHSNTDNTLTIKSGIPAGTALEVFVTATYTNANGVSRKYGGTLHVTTKDTVLVSEFSKAISSLPANTASTPCTIKIEDDTSSNISSLKSGLNSKYVKLDLSKWTNLTEISYQAFYGCKGLTSITIPNSVTSIGSSAFSGCTGLTSIIIPNSVTSIGSETFKGCTGLISVNLSDSVTSIGTSAFYNCTGLTSINIPDSVTSIGNAAFGSCAGLTSINIPNSVTSIGQDAFANCTGLTSITIPDSVTSIGSSAFYNCTGLTSVTISNSVDTIGKSAFSNCTGLTSVTIPNSVTSIGSSAFSNCTGLTSINIPNSVISIANHAFYNCKKLTSVTFEDTQNWYISSDATYDSSDTSIDVTNPATNATNINTNGTWYNSYLLKQ